jgi:hypothetical protein
MAVKHEDDLDGRQSMATVKGTSKALSVESGGPLQQWATWHGRGRSRPIAAMAVGETSPMLFVANEVLLRSDDQDLLEECLALGAEIVQAKPLLAPPPEILRSRQLNEACFSMPVLLRFTRPPETERPETVLPKLLARSGREPGLRISSHEAAAVASIVARNAAQGRAISLNVVGSPDTLAYSSATEGSSHPAGSDPFAWPPFSGRSRIAPAWQLVESVRAVRSTQAVVWVAVLDSGFWVDGAGMPLIGAGDTASDFGPSALQVNLLDEGAPVAGASGNKCASGYTCPWHGNGVASAAVAKVGDSQGAAGSGGTVGRPVFFKSDLSTDQIYRCLQYCTAWGLDVLNMSFSMRRVELFFNTSAWDQAFQFATDQGLIAVAAAGNGDSDSVGQELPDYDVRPATRTPGVITVGALDVSDNATPYSNYGSSVTIWAPGDNIPVGPDDLNRSGSTASGTSMAAPLVAGVAAMMRAVNPSLDPLAIRQMLRDTGWPGTGRVSKGLDAYAAVLAVLGEKLPADYGEANNVASAASALLATGPGGSLQPIFGGKATRSGSDSDYWKFDLPELASITITLEWYPLLARLTLSIEGDDPEDSSADNMLLTESSADGRAALSGMLSPGTYRVLVRGNADTAYELNVTPQPSNLLPDQFEPNDSFDEAKLILFEARFPPFDIFRRSWGPGTFPATLHERWFHLWPKKVLSPDFFELEVPAGTARRVPTLDIFDTDSLVDVTLYDASRQVIQSWMQVRQVHAKPPVSSTCYLQVTGSRATRYKLHAGLQVDPTVLPAIVEQAEVLPEWWLDPPAFSLKDHVTHFAIDLNRATEANARLAFYQPKEPVSLELLDGAGTIVRRADASDSGRISLETSGLAEGLYILRVSRESDSKLQNGAVDLKIAPPR